MSEIEKSRDPDKYVDELRNRVAESGGYGVDQ
jgi:hypothetical protein